MKVAFERLGERGELRLIVIAEDSMDRLALQQFAEQVPEKQQPRMWFSHGNNLGPDGLTFLPPEKVVVSGLAILLANPVAPPEQWTATPYAELHKAMHGTEPPPFPTTYAELEKEIREREERAAEAPTPPAGGAPRIVPPAGREQPPAVERQAAHAAMIAEQRRGE